MTYASLEARWLAESGEVVSGGVRRSCCTGIVWQLGGTKRSYAFACRPEPRGQRTLLLAVHYVGCGGRNKKLSWRKL